MTTDPVAASGVPPCPFCGEPRRLVAVANGEEVWDCPNPCMETWTRRVTTDPAPRPGLDDGPPTDMVTTRIRYRNHRGEIAVRRVLPHRLWYGRTEWHPDPQWLLDAYDLDREADRTFAMRDILRWGEPPHGPDGGQAARDMVNRLADAAHREGKASTDYYGYREQVNAGEEAELAGQALLARIAALEAALAAAEGERDRQASMLAEAGVAAADACQAAGIEHWGEGGRLGDALLYILDTARTAALAATPGGPREGAGEGASDDRT